MVNALLKAGNYNVMWVDWADGSVAEYTQAVANARVVGLELANFINYLKNKMGLNPQDIHIIGHSLGSHIAGEYEIKVQCVVPFIYSKYIKI